MKFLILMLLSLNLVSCAFSEDNKLESNKTLLRQNKLIDSTYGPLVGTYTGTMLVNVSSSESRTQDVNLKILILDQDISNPDGSPGVKRVPIAYFQRTAPVIDFYSLTARAYTPETGALSLVNPSDSKDLSLNDIKSLELTVTGQRLTGRAFTLSGVIGTLDISLTSRETEAPSDGNNEDIRNSYIKLYKKIEGRYLGEIINPNPKIKKKPVAIELRIVNDKIPYLRGYYSPLDTPGAGLDLAMKVDYNPNVVPARINLDGANTSPGSTYIINIDGTIEGDTITADITNVHQGYLGKLTVKKQTTLPPLR